MENGKMGPFIRQLRKERGMTQRELAAALGVTDKAVSKWELGTSLPDVALLLPLAERLGVSATELLAGVPIQEAAAKTLEIPPRDTAGDLLSYNPGGRRAAAEAAAAVAVRGTQRQLPALGGGVLDLRHGAESGADLVADRVRLPGAGLGGAAAPADGPPPPASWRTTFCAS